MQFIYDDEYRYICKNFNTCSHKCVTYTKGKNFSITDGNGYCISLDSGKYAPCGNILRFDET
jgi:hypothetical protein